MSNGEGDGGDHTGQDGIPGAEEVWSALHIGRGPRTEVERLWWERMIWIWIPRAQCWLIRGRPVSTSLVGETHLGMMSCCA